MSSSSTHNNKSSQSQSQSSQSQQHQQQPVVVNAQQVNAHWQKQPKVSAELFALTVGALVGELVRDYESPELVTAELDKMGHSMGLRGMEELLASHIDFSCSRFIDSSSILQTALKLFFGIVVDNNNNEAKVVVTTHGDRYSLLFVDNPITLFVELPDELAEGGFEYCALLTGFCRGCLELLQMDCSVNMEKSVLRGDSVNEITVQLNSLLQDGAGKEYHDE